MLGHDIAAALPELRRQAESRMTATATIRRKVPGPTVQDETTGREIPEWEPVAEDVPFRLGGGGERRVTIGGVELTLAARIGHMPAKDADDPDRIELRDGDFVEVTSGENEGTVWSVVEADRADQQTAYRAPLIATQRPEEWV